MTFSTVEVYQTSKSGRMLERIAKSPLTRKAGAIVVDVDLQKTTHPYFGTGGAMNDATNFNLMLMKPEQREGILQMLFNPKDGAGWNFVRISIGASDFSAKRYSLNDTHGDVDMKHFNVEHDLEYNISIFRRIREINPDVFFFASPWSPPGWMKDVNTMVGPGGRLRRKYYRAFALYLVRFVQEFAKHGIPIGAISVQNEVQGNHLSKPMPQCLYEPEEEADLIVDHLAPEIRAAIPGTKIWLMDHNWLMGDYAMRALEHKRCKDVVDAVAWHRYEGDSANVNFFRQRYPNLHHYFTEGNTHTVWTEHVEQESNPLEKIFRNSQESYCTWVTVLDEMGGPGEGPFIVNKESDIHGMINYHRKTGVIKTHLEHHKIAHISKFVKRGASRVFSSNEIANCAWLNPDGSVVLYINHNKKRPDIATFQLDESTSHTMDLEPHSYYTLIFTA